MSDVNLVQAPKVKIGGWDFTAETDVSKFDEAKKRFDAATSVRGATYELNLYCGTQLIAGYNDAFLSTVKKVLPKPDVGYFAFVVVQTDSEGTHKLSVRELAPLGIPGSWAINIAAGKLPEEVVTGLYALYANPNILGAEYVPLAYVGSQVVNGKNHMVLCEQKLLTPGFPTHLVILTFNQKPIEGIARPEDFTRISETVLV